MAENSFPTRGWRGDTHPGLRWSAPRGPAKRLRTFRSPAFKISRQEEIRLQNACFEKLVLLGILRRSCLHDGMKMVRRKSRACNASREIAPPRIQKSDEEGSQSATSEKGECSFLLAVKGSQSRSDFDVGEGGK